MRTSKAVHSKSGGSSVRKAERTEPRLVEAPAVDEPVPVVAVEPAQEPAAPEPEKKRRGRALSEGEPLKRVLIFLGQKEIEALKAQVGGRGISTRIREILKEHLAAKA